MSFPNPVHSSRWFRWLGVHFRVSGLRLKSLVKTMTEIVANGDFQMLLLQRRAKSVGGHSNLYVFWGDIVLYIYYVTRSPK